MAEPRATGFGSYAEVYERVRPSPPAALIDDLATLAPRSVLDVGCGTGKLGAALAARGLEVLGVEADPRMAALCPVPVEIAAFEDWDDGGRTFDLVVSGDAWHWIDPSRGEAKLARVLRGTFVHYMSFHELDEPLLSAVDEVSARLAPEVRAVGHFYEPEGGEGRVRVYRWGGAVAREDWLALVGTYGGHHALGRARLLALLDGFREVVPELVPVRFGVFSRVAVTASRASARAALLTRRDCAPASA